jgi:hypothetical protein
VSKLWTQSRFSLRADEALGAAIALGRSHEGGRALHLQEGELSLEIVTHVAAAEIVLDAQPARHVLGGDPEMAADALAQRLQRLEASAAPGGMDADALGVVVIDGDERRDLSVARPEVVVMSVPHS